MQIIERVISQTLHEHGGQERCPWSRDTMKGTHTVFTVLICV